MQTTGPLPGDVYLTRAYGFIKEAEKAISLLRHRALAHDPQVESEEPLEWLTEGLRGSKQFERLTNDLDLAEQEVDHAVGITPNAFVATTEGSLNAPHLRSRIFLVRGQLALIWWSFDVVIAKQFLNSSIQIAEFPYTHYLLGLLYAAQYDFADALRHFERCLELEPSGELSLPALREVNAMRNALKNYKKRFRGSWEHLFLLIIFFWPAAIHYFFKKRK
jgi:tetratricopeptide (TPR) repeat protein